MSQTTVNLGHVPVNRGEYSSSATYYKDNIVQYNGSSYICNVTEEDISHPTGISGITPYDSDPASPNTGWAVFANDSSGAGEGVYNVSVDHTTDNQPKIYASLSAALNDIPAAKKKGGMEIRFIFNNSNYAVDKEEGITTQPAGTLITSSPTMVDGTYKASQLLTYFSTLPTATGAGNAVVYYKEVDGTYTTWTITLQSSDNKYVRYNLLSQSFTTDAAQWAIDDTGVYVSNPEFIEAKTDTDGKLLEARKADGTKVEYGGLKVYGDFFNKNLQEHLDTKVNVKAGKSLIDENYASSQEAIENPEWLQVTTDYTGKILEGIRRNGEKYIASFKDVNTDIDDEPTEGSDNPAKSGGIYRREQEIREHVSALESREHLNVRGIGLAGGTSVPIQNNTAIIPNATVDGNGLMSASDKQKLDNIPTEVNISISGSGVTKNASAYGFLPTNSAMDNYTALMSCIQGGGTILVDLPGIYDLCNSVLIPSNTELVFGHNVFIRKQKNNNDVAATYPFINEGAFTKTYNENITIRNLHIIMNNVDTENLQSGDVPRISGLRGQVTFFYIKNLKIDGLYILDGHTQNYNVHIVEFEDVLIQNVHIKGDKDALHFGCGKRFTIRDCYLATIDDGIALNPYDYVTSSPKIGWITDGLVENIHFLEWEGLARNILLLAGSWSDWKAGNSYHSQGDCTIHNGRMYRTAGRLDGGDIISQYAPTHESGSMTYPDGLSWLFIQDTDLTYTAGCKRIHFKNLFYDRRSDDCLRMGFENSEYMRSYYPGSVTPIQEDITIEGIHMPNGRCNGIISCLTPFENLKVINCTCSGGRVVTLPVSQIDEDSGIDWGNPSILLSGNTYNQGGGQAFIDIAQERHCKLNVNGTLLIGSSTAHISGEGKDNVDVIYSDVELIR